MYLVTAVPRVLCAALEIAGIVDGFETLSLESDLFTELRLPEYCRPADNISRKAKPVCCLLAAEPQQRNRSRAHLQTKGPVHAGLRTGTIAAPATAPRGFIFCNHLNETCDA